MNPGKVTQAILNGLAIAVPIYYLSFINKKKLLPKQWLQDWVTVELFHKAD